VSNWSVETVSDEAVRWWLPRLDSVFVFGRN
jgi:hypothetical protein